MGFEEYKYLATLDYITCEVCQPLDNKVFKLSEAKEGVNYPVMHPRCRCTTTMNIRYGNRRAKNPATGRSYLVDGDMNYEQWVESLAPEQKKALEVNRLKASRRAQDKVQHAQYKKVLGTKEVPRGFDKWQEMKYTEPDRWEELKALYREKTVDKSAGSDIIKVGGDGMYRKNSVTKIEPMPESQLRKIEKRFRALGGTIQRSPETDAYLELKEAEAITYNATTILLRQQPSRASVYEELIHATQYRAGENDGTYISRLKCEIAAQEKLIKNAKAYKLTKNEVIQTEAALKAYQNELAIYNKDGGV